MGFFLIPQVPGRRNGAVNLPEKPISSCFVRGYNTYQRISLNQNVPRDTARASWLFSSLFFLCLLSLLSHQHYHPSRVDRDVAYSYQALSVSRSLAWKKETAPCPRGNMVSWETDLVPRSVFVLKRALRGASSFDFVMLRL